MRLFVLLLGLGFSLPATAQTIKLQTPAADAETFGPGDMICDLNKCRLFNLPSAPERYPDRVLVEFGFPGMSGQDRFLIRKCTGVLCRATVSGSRLAPTSRPESDNPTLFLTPAEIKLQ